VIENALCLRHARDAPGLLTDVALDVMLCLEAGSVCSCALRGSVPSFALHTDIFVVANRLLGQAAE
jgi:hypothetical protein